MAKRRYRSVQVKALDTIRLCEALAERRVVVGIDIAKEDMFAAVMDGEQHVHRTVRWKHPRQSPLFIEMVKTLRSSATSVEVVMEPSGVYGDALRYGLLEAGLPVFRVNPKRTHDAAEVYDGVPSLHDAKSAAIIAKLHLDRVSEEWPMRSDQERRLAAALRVLEVFGKQFQRNRNRMEGLLARHWPEVSAILELGSATLLELLVAYGGPSVVARHEAEARLLMERVGGRFLSKEKIELVLASARKSFSMPQIDEEVELVATLAEETRRNQLAARRAKLRVEKLTEAQGAARNMRATIGKTTAAVLVASVGDPRNYPSATAYLKSLGLNLKEKSSGKHKGGLHITKRGPGIARLYLYMAVLRLIQHDPVVRAWYAKKVRRQGGKQKSKAIVAVMRKLVLALWHVAKGEPFDSRKLFDTSRLDLRGAVSVGVLTGGDRSVLTGAPNMAPGAREYRQTFQRSKEA